METQEKINLLSYLCKVGEEFSSIRDTDQLLAKIIQTSREICNADKASILLLDKERQDLYFKETAGELGEKIKKIRVPLNENSIAGWVALNKVPASIPDVLHDKRHYKKVDQIMRYETKSLLAVPILWQDTVYGVIEVLNKKNGELFNKTDEEFLFILAAKAAVALNNVSLVEQLQNFFIYNLEIIIAISDNMEPLFSRYRKIKSKT
ncbi:MAG: GAF domain-containing protein [Armatimonadetes bacterium]|nr:GAF domain-containing protein [Armatimonadota bacterium]